MSGNVTDSQGNTDWKDPDKNRINIEQPVVGRCYTETETEWYKDGLSQITLAASLSLGWSGRRGWSVSANWRILEEDGGTARPARSQV